MVKSTKLTLTEYSDRKGILDIKKIDALIGSKIRQHRSLLGISQSELGRSLGLTFQQVQKYEKGLSHVSVGRLWELSKILGVSFTSFLEGLDTTAAKNTVFPFIPSLAETKKELFYDPMARRDVRELLKAYCSITDADVAKNVLKVVKDFAKIAKVSKK